MASQLDTQVIAIPAAGTYRIDPVRSSVTYASRHLFGLGKVRANFSIASGRLEIGESHADSRATASIDAGSFRSNSAKRDADVRSKGMLDVATYPNIEFSSTGVRGDEGGVVLLGTVAMHGVTTPVEVRVESWTAVASGGFEVLAKANHLDRYAFGVTGNKGWAGRYFDLSFEVLAVPAAPDSSY